MWHKSLAQQEDGEYLALFSTCKLIWLKDEANVLRGQFPITYKTFPPLLHHSPSILSAVSHLSTTACRLGLSGIHFYTTIKHDNQVFTFFAMGCLSIDINPQF